MKDKGKREDWYLPWVIRPELIRAHQEWQRSATPIPGSTSTPTPPFASSPPTHAALNASPPHAHAQGVQRSATSPVMQHIPLLLRKRPVGPSVSLMCSPPFLHHKDITLIAKQLRPSKSHSRVGVARSLQEGVMSFEECHFFEFL
ncbi:uncharacterized protein LOC122258135 [Penaeus japonicus]|uniref:uncharacterized protein LOC122258135 n=1 Tax=Penaeus japonicus TaxID=27405 RepID=UPI001C70BDEA|nr:uncharacterized protein LOC122258135 [Penaeus japonicus]